MYTHPRDDCVPSIWVPSFSNKKWRWKGVSSASCTVTTDRATAALTPRIEPLRFFVALLWKRQYYSFIIILLGSLFSLLGTSFLEVII